MAATTATDFPKTEAVSASTSGDPPLPALLSDDVDDVDYHTWHSIGQHLPAASSDTMAGTSSSSTSTNSTAPREYASVPAPIITSTTMDTTTKNTFGYYYGYYYEYAME